MKRSFFLAPVLLLVLLSAAQKREEIFDYSFKPGKHGGYYYVVTEKRDSLWHREAYYVSQSSMAMEGWYKDDSCQVPHGAFTGYHPTRFEKSKGNYRDGKKEGPWLGFDENGHMIDSSVYVNGRRKGVAFNWYADGTLSDSLQFDGAGNGVQVSWYNTGRVSTAGYWTQDTVKKGRWKYFHDNGSVMATEEYKDGKMIACSCFDEAGQKLDSADCLEKEAAPGDGINGWRRFLEKNLQPIVEAKARVGFPPREYTVLIRFVVEKDGTLGDFKAMTAYGKGLEEDVIRMLKKAPRWTPGRQHGHTVKSYHTQPITFVISR